MSTYRVPKCGRHFVTFDDVTIYPVLVVGRTDIQVEESYLSCVFSTAYIGLFDRSLLPMSLIQVELALKQANSKSRTPVSMYQFDPI